MKKVTLLITALALVLGLSQCRKPNAPTINGIGGTQHVVLQASFDNGGSKIAQDGTGLKWEVGDSITVRKDGEPLNPGTLKCTNAENGTFVGEIAATTGNITFTFGTEDFMNQTGELNDAIYLTSGDVAYEPSGSYDNVEMTMPHAVLKLDLSRFGSTKGNDVTITKGTEKTVIATVKEVKTSSEPMYVALPEDETEQTYTLFGNNKSVTCTWTLAGNTFFTNTEDPGGSIDMFNYATVVTIPVCAIHKNCASSGGVVTGTDVPEQGICWGTSMNPTIDDTKYVHQYEYSTGKLTPKNETINNTFTGFMSELTPGTTYHVRAYIRKGSQVKYGDDIEFTTLASEPEIQYVDLGLSVKWATCNLGAVNEYDCGDYYQWGDLAACNGTTQDEAVNCGFQSYRFAANNKSNQFTKYCSGNADYWYTPAGTPDNKFQLDLTDDCVSQTLGDDWRMPTQAEWEELCDEKNTTRTWTTSGGVSGWRFTSKKADHTDKSIFLPAAGCRLMAKIQDVGTKGNYWSSSLYTDVTGVPVFGIFSAYDTYFDSGNLKSANKYSRHGGFSVRPVK